MALLGNKQASCPQPWFLRGVAEPLRGPWVRLKSLRATVHRARLTVLLNLEPTP